MSQVARVVCPALVLALILTPALTAQQQKEIASAPVPPQVLTARKVFISNGGANVYLATNSSPGGYLAGLTTFHGEAERGYNQFYAALKGLSRYELVSTPAEAELVFEISVVSAPVETQKGSGAIPALKLVISDPKTRVVLWTIMEYIEPALRLANRDKNFDEAMARLVQKLKKLTSAPEGGKE